MKLFKVKFQTSNTSNIFYAFVIAGNETESEKITEERKKKFVIPRLKQK